MNRLVSQPLDSVHLCGDGGESIAGCACCGTPYPGSENRCQRCDAPLDLAESIRARGAPPRFIAVLGASGAGKTVYLGVLLDILNSGRAAIEGVPQGAFSVAVQETTMSALAQRRFPEKTPCESDSWNWVHCQVHRKKSRQRFVDLVTPDFAGEAIATEIEQPGTYQAIRSIVAQAQGVLMVCDAPSARAAPLAEDFFAVKLASYIDAVRQDGERNRKQRRPAKLPVAVVLTKCDQCPEVRDDPHRFASDHLTRLHHYCQNSLSHFQFFTASVVGSCTPLFDEYGCRSEVAWHVEPRGITEPLEWLMQPR